MKNKEKTSYEE
jgi:hypothetical protein